MTAPRAAFGGLSAVSRGYPRQNGCKYETVTRWSPAINEPRFGGGGGQSGPETSQEGATTAGFNSSGVPSLWEIKSGSGVWCDREIMVIMGSVWEGRSGGVVAAVVKMQTYFMVFC